VLPWVGMMSQIISSQLMAVTIALFAEPGAEGGDGVCVLAMMGGR